MEAPGRVLRRQCRRRFGLRGFLLFVVAVAAGFGWLGREIERGRRLSWVEQRLNQFGINCRAEISPCYGGFYETPDLFDDTGIRAIYRRAISTLTGYDPYRPIKWLSFRNFSPKHSDAAFPLLRYLVDLDQVTFTGQEISDDTLAALPDLPTLRRLDLYECGITDGGLRHLQRFGSLTELELWGAKITGSGLAVLTHIPTLRCLYLKSTPLTIDGLRCVTGTSNVHELDLEASAISNDAMSILVDRFPHLRSLNLAGTAVTEAGLMHLAALKNLESLELPGGTSDAVLKCIGELQALERLSCASNTKAPGITDSGLGELLKLTRLKSLEIGSTAVSSAGFEQLRRLPRLESLRLIIPRDSAVVDQLAMQKILPKVDVYVWQGEYFLTPPTNYISFP